VALGHVGKCPDPGPAPEVVHLTLSQLVVNDEYQRSISNAGQSRIRRMAKAWDWNAYKAISVAKTDDPTLFEVVDGQHTAIAAASNGNVHILPCLLMSAETLAQKAQGFVGINTAKVALTPANIYKAKVAAGDEVAVLVDAALKATDCRVLSMPPSVYSPGDTMAVGTLMIIAASRGGERLTMLLEMAKSAGSCPVSSKTLKALNLALPLEPKARDAVKDKLTQVIRNQGAARLEMIANSRTAPGGRDYETLADMLADMAKLPGHRLGLPSRSKPGWKPRERPKAAPAPVTNLPARRRADKAA